MVQDDITRMEILVRDRDVGKLQRLLAGIVLQPPVSQPVVNAAIGKNGVHAVTSGSLCSMFYEWAARSGETELSPAQIKEWLVGTGKWKESSLAYAVKCGREQGWLVPQGKGNKVKYLLTIGPAPSQAKAKKAPKTRKKA